MNINFKRISSIEAQSMILDGKADNLYFATTYWIDKNLRGYQPREFRMSEIFKYGSLIDKYLIFKVKASPKNILQAGQNYVDHNWFIKECNGFGKRKPPIIKK